MKQFICICCALLLGVASAMAADGDKRSDEAPSRAGTIYVSLQGSPVFNLYENAFSYRDNGRLIELFTPQGALSVGMDFSDAFGIRLMAEIGSDAGACNTRNTSAGGFWPYRFYNVDLFADAVLNLCGLAGRITRFRPKLYAGLGVAHTFGFTDSGHPWQKVNGSNTVPGFRGGFIGEYTWDSGFGLFFDLCGEAYTDMYNGLMPSAKDQENYEGYGGFPLDLRGILGKGLVYHF